MIGGGSCPFGARMNYSAGGVAAVGTTWARPQVARSAVMGVAPGMARTAAPSMVSSTSTALPARTVRPSAPQVVSHTGRFAPTPAHVPPPLAQTAVPARVQAVTPSLGVMSSQGQVPTRSAGQAPPSMQVAGARVPNLVPMRAMPGQTPSSASAPLVHQPTAPLVHMPAGFGPSMMQPSMMMMRGPTFLPFPAPSFGWPSIMTPAGFSVVNLDYVFQILIGVEFVDDSHPPPSTSKSALASLPSVKVTLKDLEGGGENCRCSICLEQFEVGDVASRIPCGHLFHETCVKQWLGQSNKCPMCRFELPTDGTMYGQGESGSQQLRLRVSDLSSRTVRELRYLAQHLNIDVAQCIEKQEMVQQIVASGYIDIIPEDDDQVLENPPEPNEPPHGAYSLGTDEPIPLWHRSNLPSNTEQVEAALQGF